MIIVDVTNDKLTVSRSDCPDKVGEVILLYTNHQHAGDGKPTSVAAGVPADVQVAVLGVAASAVEGTLANERSLQIMTAIYELSEKAFPPRQEKVEEGL